MPSVQTRLLYFDFKTRKSTPVARNLGSVDRPLTTSPDGRKTFYTESLQLDSRRVPLP
jgi:hypothetical protein